jgi:hypothetical protein
MQHHIAQYGEVNTRIRSKSTKIARECRHYSGFYVAQGSIGYSASQEIRKSAVKQKFPDLFPDLYYNRRQGM